MDKIEKILNIAQRRGFFYPGSEIYGPIAGFWHYGPLGSKLKRKIESQWLDFFTKEEGFYEIKGTVIMPKNVFVASRHLKSFVDPLVQCKKCKSLLRADKLIKKETGIFIPERADPKKFDQAIRKNKIKCPKCGGELSKTRLFKMMFNLSVGPTGAETAYLRPETCQSIFVDFIKIYRSMRAELPFGIAQIGRSFRNEISPRRTLLRQREFTQAEAEIFFNPKVKEFPKFEEVKDYEIRLQMLKDENPRKIKVSKALEKKLIMGKLPVYYLARIQQFFDSLGIPSEALRLREQTDEERPFYAKQAFDLEINSPLGWIEVVANHYRTDYDLRRHMEVSGQDLRVIDRGEKVLPHVWEISEGIDRTIFSVLIHCFREGKRRGWHWFQFPSKITPIQVAVFPLIKKDERLVRKAKEVYKILRREFDCTYEEKGSIGKRYQKADEIGVMASITIDHQTLDDSTCTIRNRDTTEQIRVRVKDLKEALNKFFSGLEFTSLGEKV